MACHSGGPTVAEPYCSIADDGYATLQLSENLELQVDAHPNEAEGAPAFSMQVTATSDTDWILPIDWFSK